MVFNIPIPYIVNFFLTFAFGLWLFQDAKGRDYNPGVWTFTAVITCLFFLEFFGQVLIYLIYRLLRPKGSMRPCPFCTRKYLADYAFCPHCKRPTKKDCHRCNEAVFVEESCCTACGTKL